MWYSIAARQWRIGRAFCFSKRRADEARKTRPQVSENRIVTRPWCIDIVFLENDSDPGGVRKWWNAHRLYWLSANSVNNNGSRPAQLEIKFKVKSGFRKRCFNIRSVLSTANRYNVTKQTRRVTKFIFLLIIIM